MSEIAEFSKKFHEKQLGTLEGFNALLRHSAEFELLTPVNYITLSSNIQGLNGGCATNEGIKSGNGWNSDTHEDGYSYISEMFRQRVGDKTFYATETSTSPLDAIDFMGMKEEMTGLFEIYKKACGGKYLHNHGGSVHIHNTTGYTVTRQDDENVINSLVNLDTRKIYRIIASIFVRFLPVMKYLSMTNKEGARACASGNNSYDRLHADNVFVWGMKVLDNTTDEECDTHLYLMERGSYLRILKNAHGPTFTVDIGYPQTYNNVFSDKGQGIVHWENRILDCTASPSLVSAWMSLNKAITLFAYDFARNGYKFEFTSSHIHNNKVCLSDFMDGHSAINKTFIKSQYKDMMGYLYKYFKKSACLGAIEVFDKLIEQSIPEYLEEKNSEHVYELQTIEAIWTGKTRTRDDELRGRYLRAIKSMLVPVQDNSDSFNQAIADALGIKKSQAVNLYQMFKREYDKGLTRVNLSYEHGRIVDMGD